MFWVFGTVLGLSIRNSVSSWLWKAHIYINIKYLLETWNVLCLPLDAKLEDKCKYFIQIMKMNEHTTKY